ncbi:MFS transporter [Novosphingobium sp. KCTC 2891]|uniref:MFS transporter n=1 Tax=Novosphingobium sp. KCTC 2891 TaxID=2989730 RepID=UPI0022235BCF|nr:MFS transporter [Novosphingobium sp. KCTC 2891]MCW1382935.1 MFS transporter [Novosphingobium sp. KCTC 2891]
MRDPAVLADSRPAWCVIVMHAPEQRGAGRVDGVSPPRAGTAYAWYVAGFLTVASTVSIIDRQILALMIGPVKRDLAATDTMMGLLGGLAFTLFYTLLTLPIAWLADHASRRRIIALGIFFWSLATVGCGLAASYGQLFAARATVGIGEAALGPAAISLLSDYFDRRRLPMAIAVFGAAPFIGVGLANLAGGYLVQWLEAQPRLALPLLGEVRSWQAMFVIVGLPGLVLAALSLTVREPARKGRIENGQALDFRGVLRFFAARRGFFGWHFAGFTALAIQGWALFYWVVEFFLREHGADRAGTGLAFGLIALFVGLAGGLLAGRMAKGMMDAGRPDATMRLVLVACLALAVVGVAAFLVPGSGLAMTLVAAAIFFMGWPNGLGSAALQFVVPNELKGRTMALYFVVVNFLSYTLGPLLGGLIGDVVFGGGALGPTLALMAAINYPLAAFCIWRSLPHFRAALGSAEAWRAD